MLAAVYKSLILSGLSFGITDETLNLFLSVYQFLSYQSWWIISRSACLRVQVYPFCTGQVWRSQE